jgi:hypothetical protein
MTFSLAAAMDAIAAQLLAAGVTPRAYAWPLKEVSPPCAVVGYPAEIPFDLTFGGGQEFEIPVYVLVGPAADRDTRAALSAALAGASAVKSALEGSLAGTVSDARVTSAKVETVAVGLVDYVSVVFALEVMA